MPENNKPPRELPRGDYTHGHPGVPPKNYKPPREKK